MFDTARVVSERYSCIASGVCCITCLFTGSGRWGCRITTALRSFKTEKSVSSSGAPRYCPSTFVASLMPSAFSTSSAYFASSIAFDTSGRGRAAQNMNRSGCSFLMRAAASLVCLTVWADVGCGAASVSTEVSTPASSIHFR